MLVKPCQLVTLFVFLSTSIIPTRCGSELSDNFRSRQLHTEADRRRDDGQQSQLEVVIRSIEKGLAFMKDRATSLNLDAVIGTRMVEGQLAVLLTRLRSVAPSSGLDFEVSSFSDILDRLDDVRRVAGDVSDLAIPIIRQQQTAYFNKLGELLQRDFWLLDVQSRDLNLSAIQKPRFSGEAMKEFASDECLAELFGTTGNTNEVCHVTRRCWKRMTSPGYRYYSLTHQVFYLEIGQQFGCFGIELQPLTDDLNSKFCASIYAEARQLADFRFPDYRRDLFMEQAALCGMLGYRQFFCSEWLDNILKWQNAELGCWGPELLPQNIIDHLTSDQPISVKREGRLFNDGCECHRSTVAVAALTQYVRYVIEARGQLPNQCQSTYHVVDE